VVIGTTSNCRVTGTVCRVIPSLALLILLLAISAIMPAAWRNQLTGPWGWRLGATVASLVVATGLLLCRYTHPCLDDFATVHTLHVHGWWWVQQDTYRHWSGRFAGTAISCALISLNLVAYRLTCMAMVLLLLVAVRYCVSGCDALRMHAWTFALALVALWVATMPAPAEGLCWESAALSYQSGLILDLVLLGLLVRKPSRWRWGLSALLGLCCAGCPETTVGLLAGALALGVVWTWGTSRTPGWLIGAGALVVGFAISAAAPGNHERAQALRGMGVDHLDLQQALGILAYPTQQGWYAITQTGILAAALGSALWGWTHAELVPWRRWLLILAAVWVSVIGGAAPALIFYGGIPGRAENTVHLVLMLGVFAFSAGIGATLRSRQAWVRQAAGAHRPTLLGITLLILALAGLQAVHNSDALQLSLACLAAACVAAAYRWTPSGRVLDRQVLGLGWALACCLGCYINLASVRQDLWQRAPEWNRQLTLREDYLRRPQTRDLVHVRVPAIDADVVPLTIAVGDISPAPQDWINAAYASAFGVRDIGVQSRLVWDETSHLPVMAPRWSGSGPAPAVSR